MKRQDLSCLVWFVGTRLCEWMQLKLYPELSRTGCASPGKNLKLPRTRCAAPDKQTVAERREKWARPKSWKKWQSWEEVEKNCVHDEDALCQTLVYGDHFTSSQNTLSLVILGGCCWWLHPQKVHSNPTLLSPTESRHHKPRWKPSKKVGRYLHRLAFVCQLQYYEPKIAPWHKDRQKQLFPKERAKRC